MRAEIDGVRSGEIKRGVLLRDDASSCFLHTVQETQNNLHKIVRKIIKEIVLGKSDRLLISRLLKSLDKTYRSGYILLDTNGHKCLDSCLFFSFEIVRGP